MGELSSRTKLVVPLSVIIPLLISVVTWFLATASSKYVTKNQYQLDRRTDSMAAITDRVILKNRFDKMDTTLAEIKAILILQPKK